MPCRALLLLNPGARQGTEGAPEVRAGLGRDGELGARTPARFRVNPSAIEVSAPAPVPA